MANAIEKNTDSECEVDRINLDTILITEIGQFGKFQLRTLILAMVVAIFGSWSSEFLFTAARIETRCVIPECDASEPDWSPYWLPNAVPLSNQGSFDNCQRFANNTALFRLVESETCPSSLFDREEVRSCDEYVYKNNNTIVYEFGLACDEWRRSLIGTVRTFGTLLSLPITGYISEHWGRRMAVTLNAFNTAWLGLVRYWANTYVGFMISEVVEAIFGSGGFSSIYILLMELVGPKYRVAVGAAISTSFAVGSVILGLVAWAIPNWRTLTVVLYVPQLLTFSYFWLLAESIRWYISKGRFEKSEELLKKVSKVNCKPLSAKCLRALRKTAEEEREAKKKTENVDNSLKEPWLIIQVFREKRVLLRCVVSPVWWISMTFIYYGLSINAVNMSGNEYVNYIAVSAVEIPGYWTAVYLLAKLGRKPVMIGGYWTCAVCQLAYIFLPSDMYGASLAVYLIAKYAISMVVTSLYVYTAELYPTKYRHTLFAFSSMIGRIGSIVAPLTPAIGAQWFEDLPFVLFASFALLSGSLVFLTPETLGTKLPDTLEQAVQIGLKPELNNS